LKGNLKILKYLFLQGAKFESKNEKGINPLDIGIK
jgi:hypothetical protein